MNASVDRSVMESLKSDSNNWKTDVKLEKLAQKFYSGLNSAVSLSCWILFRNREYAQLVNKAVNPLDYDCCDKFAIDYAASCFLKKYSGFSHRDLAPEKAAITSSISAERQCRDTNVRFHSPESFGNVDTLILLEARRIISGVLQSCPSVSRLVELGVMPSYGPGASSSCRGEHVILYNKLTSRLDCTELAVPYAKELLGIFPRLVPSYPDADVSVLDVEGTFCVPYAIHIVPGNSFTTVPKNAKTHRPICIEPHVNIVLQKMYGQCIRSRLRRWGIDLDRQDVVNAELARIGSIDGSYATIDLASASDTIATELVRFLLPPDWFEVLNALRSHRTRFDDTVFHVDGNGVANKGKQPVWLHNEKFSSMGNGFTFELESLIFFALTRAAACNTKVSVYGDDIVVGSAYYNVVERTLQQCGFTISPSKSFHLGPFRESCGSDFFLGQNIRPYFLKDPITHEREAVSAINGIRHFASRLAGGLFTDCRLRAPWRYLVDNISLHNWSSGPVHLGDTVIWASRDEIPGLAVPTWYAGVFLVTMQKPVPQKFRGLNGHPRLLSGVLMSLLPESSGDPRLAVRTKRGLTTKMKSCRIPVENWNVPPWLI